MKAVVLVKLNTPLELWDLEYDECAPGQVLVDIKMSGICGSQLQEIAGNKGNIVFIPHLLGHEGSGIIKKVGQGISNEIIGKKVVCHWRKGEGGESFVQTQYKSKYGLVGGGHITTLSELALISRNRVTIVPNDTPDELCALLGCCLSTALGTIEQEAKLKFGESILVIGCGGVGLNIIQVANLACAYPIIAIDVFDEKRDACLANGASKYINIKKESIKENGFDVIVDTSGNIGAIETTIPLLKSGGRFVMVGQPEPHISFKVLNAINMFQGEGKRIIATQGGGFRPHFDIPRYINLWRSGKLRLDTIVSHYIKLNEINQGIELVRTGHAGRVMVTID